MPAKFQVVVPIINYNLIEDLLQSIAANTLIPEKIVIVDNSKIDPSLFNTHGLRIEVFKQSAPLSVNPSWNLGLSKITDCDFVSILNDDIILPNKFFENLVKVFKVKTDAGVVCPWTVINTEEFKIKEGIDRVIKMKRKEGWAWTIRKDLVDDIPPIHSDLQLFYGDDWFWWHTHKRKKVWVKDLNTIIYHAVGASCSKIPVLERTRQTRDEKFKWYALKRKMLDSGKYKNN